jgi:hypothetical protein
MVKRDSGGASVLFFFPLALLITMTLERKINDFNHETFASLPEVLQAEFKRTMSGLLDKIEATMPDCSAPARVLEAFVEYLEPARASSFNPTRSTHSYNAYQQLVAMKEVEPGKKTRKQSDREAIAHFLCSSSVKFQGALERAKIRVQ